MPHDHLVGIHLSMVYLQMLATPAFRQKAKENRPVIRDRRSARVW